MVPNIQMLLKNFDFNDPIEIKTFDQVVKKSDCKFPEDYLDFIKGSNGGEGDVGENGYLQLWAFEELTELNKDYETELNAPGFLIFGSDGGGTAYAFRKADGHIHSFEFIGMLIDDDPHFLGKNFLEFLQNLDEE